MFISTAVSLAFDLELLVIVSAKDIEPAVIFDAGRVSAVDIRRKRV